MTSYATFSFLRIRLSLSTSILAKGWRFLWTHASNLEFYGFDFKGETQASDIIHRVVVLHRARAINTFRLCHVECNEYQLATWITHTVNRGVRNIYIDLKNGCISPSDSPEPATFTLPRCLFTCETLVDVKLQSGRGITSSGKVFWPNLKKLHLSSIMFEDDGSLSHLLSGCPVLEDLILYWCKNEEKPSDYGLGLVFVSSPTVKKLDVTLAFGCHKLKINAPSLEYLNVIEGSLEDITSLTTMTSLIEAHISLIGEWEEDVKDISNTEYANVLQFLNSLCNVKCLIFSIEEHGKGVSVEGLDSLVKFDNLTTLDFNLLFDFDEIVKFLKVADNLEVLEFTLCGMHSTYREPKQVPTCMLSRLKTIRIILSRGFNARDFKTIRYLLRNAQVLETMAIYCSSISYSCSTKKKLGLLRRIPLLKKGSVSCKLVLH